MYTSLVSEISKTRDPSFQEFWARGLRGTKQTGFFGGFIKFFVPFFASRQSLCTWHGYFEKILVLACFFWSLGALLQSSATPQGSPPPTQQIKIQMQIGWVGRSTNSRTTRPGYAGWCSTQPRPRRAPPTCQFTASQSRSASMCTQTVWRAALVLQSPWTGDSVSIMSNSHVPHPLDRFVSLPLAFCSWIDFIVKTMFEMCMCMSIYAN